jgi:AraC-like DNA-binding protein
MDMENRLLNLLTKGDAAGSREVFDRLFAANMENEPSEYALDRLLDDVELTLIKHGGGSAPPGAEGGSIQMRRGRILEWIDRCARSRGDGKDEDSRSRRLFDQVMRFAEEHLCDAQLSLKMLGDRFGLKLSTLSRLIKKHSGLGYLQVVNRRRIELAKRYLRENAVSIKELAVSVGFESEITFRRQFRKYEGIPPADYRK